MYRAGALLLPCCYSRFAEPRISPFGKDLILFVRNRHCGKLNRGLQNLDSPFGKVLILFVRNRHCSKLNRGLQNLESPFGKVLILFVRNRHCGELLRGLENLESPERETFLFFSLVRKEPKVPQRVATLWTPGDDSNLRSIRSFYENDQRSSCNRRYRKTQPSRVSPVRI